MSQSGPWWHRLWPTPDSGPTLADWRAALTAHTVRTFVAITTLSVALLVATYWRESVPPTAGIPLAIVMVVLGTLALVRTPRASALVVFFSLLIAVPFVFAAYGASAAGYVPLLSVCVVAVLLIGPGSAPLFVALSLLSVLVGGWLHLFGATHLHSDDIDPTPLMRWVRLTLIWFGCTSAVVFVTAWLVRRFEDALAAQNRAISEAATESRRRVESESLRSASETALIEAQRHGTLGRLAGGIAHDFNNALFVILGWNDFLIRDDVSPDQRRQAHAAIHDAARNAAELSKRLVALHRERTETARVTRLQPIVADASRMLARLLPDDVRVESETGEAAAVNADPGELQQIVFNLVLAARDLMTSGGRIVITVSDAADTGTGEEVALTVRFETARDPLGPHQDGAMAISLAGPRAIVERSGGTLNVRFTSETQGSFEVFLPSAPGTRGTPGAAAPVAPGGPTRILVVEDDDAARQLIVTTLRTRRHEVVEAPNGDVAVARILEEGPGFGMMCLDGIIPGASSMTVLERFRECHPNRPVLVCSGYLGSARLQELVREGRLPLLKKPFTPDELLARVDALLAEVGAQP